MALKHTANYSINVFEEVLEDRLVSRRLWSARSSDLNTSDFYLWGDLKNKAFSNNPQILDETVTSIEASELAL
jgi:hypothetical protein